MNFDNWQTGVLLKTADGNRDKNKTSFATMYWSRLQEEQTQVTELFNTKKNKKLEPKIIEFLMNDIFRLSQTLSETTTFQA